MNVNQKGSQDSMDLSILIPTHRRDAHYLGDLCRTLYAQAELVGVSLEILIHIDNGEISTGEKSNQLMAKATGKYLCRVDADDQPTIHYMDVLAGGIRKDVDCVSLMGIITTDGAHPEKFEHSLKYSEYRTNENVPYEAVKYERFPNHLNCVRASIAKQFRYPDKTISEDTAFATQMFKSGLLKIEHYDPRVIYYYRYKTKK